MDYHQPIREFIVTTFLYGEAESLRDDTSFLQSGIIDSTGILELITFVERSFGIRILEEEMVPENVDSVDRLARFVANKLAKPAAEAPPAARP